MPGHEAPPKRTFSADNEIANHQADSKTLLRCVQHLGVNGCGLRFLSLEVLRRSHERLLLVGLLRVPETSCNRRYTRYAATDRSSLKED
jgi:hypothetical protein